MAAGAGLGVGNSSVSPAIFMATAFALACAHLLVFFLSDLQSGYPERDAW